MDRRRHSGAQGKTREPGNRIWIWARSQVERSRVLPLFRRGHASVKIRLKRVVKKRLRGQAYYWKVWTEEPNFRITVNLLDKIREEIHRLSARLFLVAIPSPAELRQLENGISSRKGAERYPCRLKWGLSDKRIEDPRKVLPLCSKCGPIDTLPVRSIIRAGHLENPGFGYLSCSKSIKTNGRVRSRQWWGCLCKGGDLVSTRKASAEVK